MPFAASDGTTPSGARHLMSPGIQIVGGDLRPWRAHRIHAIRREEHRPEPPSVARLRRHRVDRRALLHGLQRRVKGRLIGGAHVQHAGLGIGGGAAPVGAAKLARNGNLILRDAERRKDAFIARVSQNADDARALRLVKIWVHVGFGELQPRERRRLGRKRLGRRRLLAGHVALRHRPLLDRPDRLARDAIEDIQQSELRGLRDDVDRLAVVR